MKNNSCVPLCSDNKPELQFFNMHGIPESSSSMLSKMSVIWRDSTSFIITVFNDLKCTYVANHWVEREISFMSLR